MKGVILGINPSARIVDLSHAVPPQDVATGARLLAESYRYFPPDAIFVAVVDPGVGSARRGIALQTPHGRFVGPDNGLFGAVLGDLGLTLPPEGGPVSLRGHAIQATILENLAYFLPRVSATFHGRDVFAPVAAHLSLGVPLGALGPATESLIVLPGSPVEIRPGEIRGRVTRVDHFGNAITNITSRDLASIASPIVEVAGTRIFGLSGHYAQRNGLLALIGSGGFLEIALNGGDAAAALGVGPGDPVVVRRCPDRGESP
jgi:S-adenosylmethionine hydrolase